MNKQKEWLCSGGDSYGACEHGKMTMHWVFPLSATPPIPRPANIVDFKKP